MASSSGTTTSSMSNPGSDDRVAALDQRRQKRKLSNRESARRSRQRKQKHVDDLMAELSQLRAQNSEASTALSVATQSCAAVEAQNSVLRTQTMELTSRLHSLNEILRCMNSYTTAPPPPPHDAFAYSTTTTGDDSFIMNPWSMMYPNQPLMAAADVFEYY